MRRQFFIQEDSVAAAAAATGAGVNVAGASNLPGRGPSPGATGAKARAEARKLFSSNSELIRIENLPPARRRAALMGIRSRFHRLSTVARQLHALLRHAPAAGVLSRGRRGTVGRLTTIARETLRADAVDVYIVDKAGGRVVGS